MNKRNLIDVISLLVIFFMLFLFTCYLSIENQRQEKQIHELENQIYQQIELIDALQQ